jgi:hypothetical protein
MTVVMTVVMHSGIMPFMHLFHAMRMVMCMLMVLPMMGMLVTMASKQASGNHWQMSRFSSLFSI